MVTITKDVETLPERRFDDLFDMLMPVCQIEEKLR